MSNIYSRKDLLEIACMVESGTIGSGMM